MKKKNLLLTLAMLPTMLLGVTALASCGSNTKYNAENAITRRAFGDDYYEDIEIDGIDIGQITKVSSIANLSDTKNIINVVNESSAIFEANGIYLGTLCDNLKDDTYNSVLLALSVPTSFGTPVAETSTASNGAIVESPTKLVDDEDHKTFIFMLKDLANGKTFQFHFEDMGCSTGDIVDSFSQGRYSTQGRIKFSLLKGSNLSYSKFNNTYSSNVTVESITTTDDTYSLGSGILFTADSSNPNALNFNPNNVTLPVSSDGKSVLKITYKKAYAYYFDSISLYSELNVTNSSNDIEFLDGTSENDDYFTRYIIFNPEKSYKLFIMGDSSLINGNLNSCFLELAKDDSNAIATVCKSSGLVYKAENAEDLKAKYGNITALGTGMQLEEVFTNNGGQNFYFEPTKIKAPASKDGKKIIKFVAWKHFNAFRLKDSLPDVELVEMNDEVDESGDFTTRYLIYPATYTKTIYLECFIADNMSPVDTLFDEADPEICLVKACRASNLEYEDQIKDGGTKTIVINVDSHYTEDDIISQVSAIDLFGVSVPVTKVSSDYVVGKTGKFNIVLSATDSYGQTSTATLICDVRDYSAPTITQKNAEIKYDYGTLLTEAKLLENFVLADNMGTDGLKTKFIYPTGFDISKALVFGSYNLTLEVTDAFNNKATKSFTLSVVDNVAPVISKISGDIGDKIKISYSTIGKNTINTILGYFKATDAIDGDCEIYLKDGKIPSEMAGDFTLKIGAKDKSGNEAIYTINCEVVADLPPVFILSDKLVNATISNPLDLTDLQNIVQKAILKKTVNNLQINASGYLANSDKVGSYPVSYTYYDDNMEVQSGAFTLQVTEDLPVAKEDNYFVNAFKTVFKHVTEATATQWIVVIATFLIPALLIGFVVNYVMKCIDKAKKEEEMKKARRKSNSKNYKRKW